MPISLSIQIINLLAAMLLLIAFAMLSQRRILSLIKLFAWQGLVLSLSTFVVAYSTGQHHLYYSAGLTLVLKVLFLPWLLHRLMRKLNVRWDVETLINIPTTMLVGIALVIFSFNLAAPISQLSESITRGLIGAAVHADDADAAQGDSAGGRFPGDGKRIVLCRDQRHARHAAGGGTGYRSGRAGGHLHIRYLLLPDPRDFRQPRHLTHGKAQG
jgi:hypothetical protein